MGGDLAAAKIVADSPSVMGMLPRLLLLKVLGQLWQHKHLPLNSMAEFKSLPKTTQEYCKNLYERLLRQCGQIDALIAKAAGPSFEMKNYFVVDVLRLLTAEFIFMKLSAADTVKAVEELLQNTRYKTHKELGLRIIKLVMVGFKDTPLSDASYIHNVPKWLFKRWHLTHGLGACQQIVLTLSREPGFDFAFKDDSFASSDVKGRQLPHQVVRVQQKADIEQHDLYFNGHCWGMDWSQTLPAHFTKFEPGSKLLDLCAAPGAKAFQFVLKGADVTLVDISKPAIEKLKNNFARTKVKAEVVIEIDALKWQSDILYDLVLVDPPSSGTGNLRRDPERKYLLNEENITAHCEMQQNLLRVAYQFLKPGGTLIYTTNSLEPEENKRQIEAFLASHTDCVRLPFDRDEVGGLGNFVTEEKDLLVLPFAYAEMGGCDGLFISRLEKSKTLETGAAF